MTNKIEISRELAERIVKDGVISVAQLDQLRALLAANPEENEPCPQCGGSLRTWGCTCTPRWPMYKPEIAAPAVEHQEPVGFRYRAHGGHWEWMDESPFADGREHYKLGGEELQPLYTSPPAPVAVVLPEKLSIERKVNNVNFNHGWNACLDKVKEMNQ